jgi:hypothetical protein
MKFGEAWDFIDENKKITSRTKLSKGNKIIFAELLTDDYTDLLGVKAVKGDADYRMNYVTAEILDGQSSGNHSWRTYHVRLEDGTETFVGRNYIIEKLG